MALDLNLAGKVSLDAKQARAELKGTTKDAQATKAAVGQIGKEAKETDADIAALRNEIAQYRKQMQGLSADNMAAVQKIDVLQSEIDQLNAKLKGTGGAGKSAAGGMGNLVAQFNDIGIMMAAGQNPLQLAIQQGTQVTQVIGPMGAAGAARALGGAFLSMLSPINLVTIGGIAMGAALVKWLSSSGEEARDLDDVIVDVEQSLSSLQEVANTTGADLLATFGEISPEILQMQRDLQQLRLREYFLDVIEAVSALSSEFDDGFLSTTAMQMQSLFNVGVGAGGQLASLLNDVENARGFNDQLLAVEALQQRILEITGGIHEMDGEQAAFYDQTLDVERSLRMAVSLTKEMPSGISAAADAAARMAENVIKAVAATQELTSQAQVDMETAKIRLQYADDPVEQARQLGIARYKREQAPLYEGASPLDMIGLGNEASAYGDLMAQTAQLDQQRLASLKSNRGGGGEGAKSASDALAKLIDREREQLALLRETDPVQQELIRNREALAGATDAERAAVEDLIRTRIEEQDALDALQGKQEFFSDTAYNAIEGLVLQGDSLVNVFEDIAAAISKAVLQAALLGDGPLAGLFGGAGSGGLLGSLAQIFVPAKADGGPIHEEGLLSGRGSGTSDSILMYGSSGEFMMNAKATKRYRHVLELMNAGGIPKFANGGAIGGGSGVFSPQLNILPMNNSSVPLNMEVEETTDARGQPSYKLMMSDAVATGMGVRGGKAQRAMQGTYGLKRQGIAR